ncbi:MAG TPA: methyltransferase domain-containing protein [Bryobacteraceae bacterium]|jgi:ubiquinone/menaquinone biosynthesis C-methylase UbiE|nr:methyltransferase domain-containing protein [Bryobacteraceae bacterium]
MTPAFDPAPNEALVEKMRREWDERARENARHYVATAQTEWNDDEYFESGRENVRREILTDMGNICQGKNPKQMKVLEIGCGSGRITRALSEVFGQVYAVDISGEMVRQAREALRDRPNAHVFQNSGADLKILGDIQVDFAFSYIVFQHIPSREVIYSYVREVARLLRPGGLFKFQVQGGEGMDAMPEDTWLGSAFSDADAVQMAESCGFEPRYRNGAGSQYFWLWFFRKS